MGEILTSDGKITENSSKRYNKGIITVNTILSLLKEVHFGKYYMEMAFSFRNSMLVHSILCSIEAFYGMTNAHMDKIEKVDKYLLKQNLNASFATLYLETGCNFSNQ